MFTVYYNLLSVQQHHVKTQNLFIFINYTLLLKNSNHVHTAIFKMNSQQGLTVEHMEFCSMLYGSLDGRGVWRGMDTCIYMAESLHCLPETITTFVIGSTPIQNKKS